MSSKQDANFEQKMTNEVTKGEQDDMEPANKKARIVKELSTIKFPNETWEEIIMWCNRVELGENVSLANDRLFCISYNFMHVEKEHQLSKILIYGENNESWMKIDYCDGSCKKLSKAEIPTNEITENITAGELFYIYELDNDVIQFVRLLAPIYSAISLYLDIKKEKLCKPELKEFIRLFDGKVQGLFIFEDDENIELNVTLSQLHEYYPKLLNNLEKIYFDHEMTLQDSTLLMNWFYQPRDGGKARIVQILSFSPLNREFIQSVKEEFKTANRPTTFLIMLKVGGTDNEDLPCNIVNAITKERLTIQCMGYRSWLIARLPENSTESLEELNDIIFDSLQCLPTLVYRDKEPDLESDDE